MDGWWQWGVREHTFPLCSGLCIWVGGWGAPGLGCIQRAVDFALGALYESTCKRLQPVWLDPALNRLSPGTPRRADRQRRFSMTGCSLSSSSSSRPPPLANNSYSAGYQPPSLRINYHTGPVSLILDTFYTTLILNTNFFFPLF